jgi:hypothetical protein
MPAGLQVLNIFKQNLTGGAFEALAAGTGDSLTFFNVPQGSQAYIAEVWGVDDANPCEIEITASRFHDQVAGIRCNVPDGDLVAMTDRCTLLVPRGFDQPIYPSDVMTVQANGTAADNVNVTMILRYDDIPGISARLATADYVRSSMKNLVGIRVVPTGGAGQWGTSVTLTSTESRLHANTDYALLGWTTTLTASAIAISGIDTGNLKVGGPSLADGGHDSYFFSDLSDYYGVPAIPVINSNNAGATNVQVAHPTSRATAVDLLFAELSRPFSG